MLFSFPKFCPAASFRYMLSPKMVQDFGQTWHALHIVPGTTLAITNRVISQFFESASISTSEYITFDIAVFLFSVLVTRYIFATKLMMPFLHSFTSACNLIWYSHHPMHR